jgi:hypothetical protein
MDERPKGRGGKVKHMPNEAKMPKEDARKMKPKGKTRRK